MTPTDHAVFDAAKAGDRAAFAAVVARTASTVYAALPPEGDRYRQLRAVYAQAMRDLSHGAQPDDLDVWLHKLAADTKPRRERRSTWHSFSPETHLDDLWHDLAVLWPSGRRQRRIPGTKTAITAVALALAGSLAVFATQTAQHSTDTLRAVLYQPDRPDTGEANDDDASTPSDAPLVPIIPLPPPSADDPRPTPAPPVASDDGVAPEPGDTDEEDGETEDLPDEVSENDTPSDEGDEPPAS